MVKKQIVIVLLGVSLLICAGGGKKHKGFCWDSSESGCACSRKEEIMQARLEKERRNSEFSSSVATVVTPRIIELAVKKLCSKTCHRVSR